MNKLKKGFTLLEMTAVLAVMGAVTIMHTQSNANGNDQLHAKAMGKEIYQYNIAVNHYLYNLSETLGDEDKLNYSAVMAGSNWLKSSSCENGLASGHFLPCESLPGGSTLYGSSAPSTEIFFNGEHLVGKTSWSQASRRGSASESFMGLAALVATGSYMHDEKTLDGQGTTLYCPDMDYHDSKIRTFCSGNAGKIVSISSSSLPSSGVSAGDIDISAIQDKFLSTQGLNTMQSYLEFSEDGIPSTQAELDAVDSSTWRQIVNVARIYNRGESGNDSLILGSTRGDEIYTMDFITSNNLLTGAVIADGSLGVAGHLTVSGSIKAGDAIFRKTHVDSLVVNTDLLVKGAFYINRLTVENLESYADITVHEGDLYAQDVGVMGEAFFKHGIRTQGGIRIDEGDIHARSLRVNNDIYAGRIISSDPFRLSNFNLQPSGTEGESCEYNGSIAMGWYNNDDSGLLACVNGTWRKRALIQTGGMHVAPQVDNHVEIANSYLFPSGVNTYEYQVTEAQYNNYLSGIYASLSSNPLSCDVSSSEESRKGGYVRYEGSETYRCISI